MAKQVDKIPEVSVVLMAKIPDEWQAELAEFAIFTMRKKTKVRFELIIVEAGTAELRELADQHIVATSGSYTEQFNQGADLAKAPYIVHTAIDIIVGERWLEALLEPFDLYADAGVTTTSVTEPGAVVGEKYPTNIIVEGMYGPLMMFPAEHRLDPAFPNLHSDSDLVMRIYQQGKRSYRNQRSVCHHLDGITWKSTTDPATMDKQRSAADAMFRSRYQSSPLWMAKVILRGGVLYGKEHQL